MMSPVIRSVYQSHARRGLHGELLLTVAVPAARAGEVIAALGEAPTRARNIPITVAIGSDGGHVAAIVTESRALPRRSRWGR